MGEKTQIEPVEPKDVSSGSLAGQGSQPLRAGMSAHERAEVIRHNAQVHAPQKKEHEGDRMPPMERKMSLSFGYDPASGRGAIMTTDEDTGLMSVVAESQRSPAASVPEIDKGVVIDHEDE